MKSLPAAGAAVFFALFIAGCTASPPPAPVVQTPSVDQHDVFRPDQSSCQPNVTWFKSRMSELGYCLQSLVEEIDRRPGLDLLPSDGSAVAPEQYTSSPCRQDLTSLTSHDLGTCYRVVSTYQAQVIAGAG